MFSSQLFARRVRMPLLALAMTIVLAGCESKQDKAIDQAKKQAVTTGQPQQVVSVDKAGTTTTTVVQPPVKGPDHRGDDDYNHASAAGSAGTAAAGSESVSGRW